jgi:hypothetical protein
MPANYVLLEKITVGAAGANSVTFSGIPQTGYTDLVVKISGRSDTNGANPNRWRDVTIGFNGTGSNTNVTNRVLYGLGNSVGSISSNPTSGGAITSADATASTFSNTEIYIPNYTSSSFKSYSMDNVTENNATAALTVLLAGLWSNTAAINSIALFPDAGNFAANSTFYLYGVAKLGTTPVIVPYATGGDTIMTDGTYWYHTFLSSGTFTPAKGLSCDYLVVAGGGGSGVLSNGGGGGAGGLRSTVTATGGGGSLESALSLASGTAYTVTIGGGGASQTNGTNSVFSTITATGGGKGGNGGAGTAGSTGGSGGGGGNSGATGGAGTTNQGYAGGAGYPGNAPSWASGGGGGANAVGGNGVIGGAGAGGNGVQITALATPTSTGANSGYYAGGGGGSNDLTGVNASGGLGGGGTGGSPQRTGGGAGTANTGGGAGGYDYSGGSGIVIVRYAV